MLTWTETLCGREVKFGLRTERDDFAVRRCPPYEIITIIFRGYGLDTFVWESVKINTLIDNTTNEEAVAGLIKRHGTKGYIWGFVDEY